MIHVNEQRLESDLSYRFHYLSEFMGFGAEDVAAIHAAAPSSLRSCRRWSTPFTTSFTATTPPGGTSCPGKTVTKGPCRRPSKN